MLPLTSGTSGSGVKDLGLNSMVSVSYGAGFSDHCVLGVVFTSVLMRDSLGFSGSSHP